MKRKRDSKLSGMWVGKELKGPLFSSKFLPSASFQPFSSIGKFVTNSEPVLYSEGQLCSFLINFPFSNLRWLIVAAPTLLKQGLRPWVRLSFKFARHSSLHQI